jgi:hypothetical protein
MERDLSQATLESEALFHYKPCGPQILQFPSSCVVPAKCTKHYDTIQHKFAVNRKYDADYGAQN